MSDWQDVSTAPPPRNTIVSVCGSKRLKCGAAFLNDSDEWLIETCTGYENIYPPKYWQPFPDLPELPELI